MAKVLEGKRINKDLEYYSKLPYNIIVEPWDDGHGIYWVARIAELPHCLIHGDTPEDAAREIEEVKRDWIESNLQRGLPIPEPVPHRYSGQIRLRMPPSLHKLIYDRANIEQISINQYMNMALAKSVGLDSPMSGSKHSKKKPSTTNKST
jgi:predicted RNase H-like HicB family nuclease